MAIITGITKIEKLEHAGNTIFVKREDHNASGSFKDRLINHIWAQLQSLPQDEIVLSSSGNLAISLLHFKRELGLDKKIKVFIAENLPETKLTRLNEYATTTNSEIIRTKRPKSECFRYARDNDVFWLRNSDGEDYPQAYESMATEITTFEQESGELFDVVFVCCSSGTATQGLLQGLQLAKRNLPVYVVQTSRVHPLAKVYDDDYVPEAQTLANAISDNVMPRRAIVQKLLTENGGGGVIAANSNIEAAQSILNSSGLGSFTGNGALGLAGFFKLMEKGYNFSRPLVIISGN